MRTWTLATLDPETVYRLWFDPVERRWEVRPIDQETGTLVTRSEPVGVAARKARVARRVRRTGGNAR